MSKAHEHQLSHPDIDPARQRILLVILSAIFMTLLSISIVNVALPSIQSSLQTTFADLQWILSGYALSFGVFLVGAGRAGDLFGRGALFIFGAILFTVASIAAGFAPDPLWLNVARVFQGIGSGFLNPQGVGMIQQYFHGKERGRAFGLFGTAVGLSVAIGPVLGGLMIKVFGPELGWRLTFLINVPAGILTIVLAWLWFPRPLLLLDKFKKPGWFSSLDPVGASLLGLAVLAILFPFVESYRSALLWLLIPLGLFLIWLFVRWERYYEKKGLSPMVNLGVFSIPSFRNGSIVMSLFFLGMSSVWVLVPIYLQQGLGFSAFAAGSIGIPAALLSSWASNRAGNAVGTYGIRVVIFGITLTLLGVLLCILTIYLNTHYGVSIWWLAIGLSLFGMGQGITISPNQTLTLSEVPLNYAGSSGAVVQTGQRIGTSIGIAVITALVFTLQPLYSWMTAMVAGYLGVFIIISLSLLLSLKDWKRIRHTVEAVEQIPPSSL
ncbi:MAG: MFS transporter [Alcaligenaceae bacterium]|nr:MFS transporter [Alcaligenaceae bacterium]